MYRMFGKFRKEALGGSRPEAFFPRTSIFESCINELHQEVNRRKSLF